MFCGAGVPCRPHSPAVTLLFPPLLFEPVSWEVLMQLVLEPGAGWLLRSYLNQTAFGHLTPLLQPIPGVAFLLDSPNYCAFLLKMLSPQVAALGLSGWASGNPARTGSTGGLICLPPPKHFSHTWLSCSTRVSSSSESGAVCPPHPPPCQPTRLRTP